MKFTKRFFYLFFTYIFLILIFSCSSEDAPAEPEKPADAAECRRTVLVYIVANNNLGATGYDAKDIREMILGAKNGNLPSDTRWLVYHAPYGNRTCRLFEITATDTTTLKEYSAGLSATYARMTEVFDDMARLAPAAAYGLVLWSHGSGWIVNGIDEELPQDSYGLKSFGNDDGQRMNVATLRAAIKGREIDYVYFDVCYMGGVEVAYEMRDATELIVACPAEMPSDGMPYDINMAALSDGSRDAIVTAAANTFEYYSSLPHEVNRTCTMSVIDTSALDRLAEATAYIYDLTPLPHPSDLVTDYSAGNLAVNAIDFGEYVNALCEESKISPELSEEFNAALESAVIYKAATPKLWGVYPIYTASGLSTYFFTSTEAFKARNYNTLQWARDVAARHLH